MTTTNLAYINPDVLVWARERAKMGPEELAALLKVPPDVVSKWESGEHPTFAKAEQIAEKLHIPFGYLFLSKHPRHEIPIPDLRTVGTQPPKSISVDFIDILRTCLLKQEWYSEYLRASGKPRLAFPGSMAIQDGVDAVAEAIRTALGITDGLREESDSWEQFRAKLVEASENIGILVMQSGVGANNLRPLSVKEFRGFAVVDPFAPLVFVNSRDAGAARIFTLIHELAHIWIGQSGISNPELRKKSSEQSNVVERFCNKVAAEVLVPRHGFIDRWDDEAPLTSNIQRLARFYRVSRYVVVRQAMEQSIISEQRYQKYLDTNPSVWKAVDSDGEGGNFYLTFFARNSKRVIRAVSKALNENTITYREASKLFGVKIGTVKKVSERFGV